jgi:hypothetical protein
MPSDTSPEALAVQSDAWRQMGPDGRTRMALAFSDELREAARAGIRRRHPTYDDEQMKRAFVRMLYGDDVARRCWPDEPLTAL